MNTKDSCYPVPGPDREAVFRALSPKAQRQITISAHPGLRADLETLLRTPPALPRPAPGPTIAWLE